MKRITLFLVIWIAGVLSTGIASADLIWQEFNGSEYALTSDWGTWAAAEAEAISHGGHLATINDAAENDWLTQTFANTYNRDHYGSPWQANVWIGYYFNSDSGEWEWSSGDTATYTNLAPGFPYGGGTLGYLHVTPHPQPGMWNANPLHSDDYSYQPKGIIERPSASGDFSYDIDRFTVVFGSSIFIDEFDDDDEPPSGPSGPSTYFISYGAVECTLSSNAESGGFLTLNSDDVCGVDGGGIDVFLSKNIIPNDISSIEGKFRFLNGIAPNTNFKIEIVSSTSNGVSLAIEKSSNGKVFAIVEPEGNGESVNESETDISDLLTGYTEMTIRLDISTSNVVTASLDFGSDGTFDITLPGTGTLFDTAVYVVLFAVEEDDEGGDDDGVDDGLVAYYPFNGNANDESGNGHNGIVNGATLTDDRFGSVSSAYHFSGFGQYIELAGSEDLTFTTGGFTLSAWIQVGSAVSNGETMIIAKHLGGYPNGFFLDVMKPSDLPSFFVNNDPRLYVEVSLNDALWHHMVGVFDGSMQSLYVDGQLRASQDGISYTVTNDTPIAIGRCYPADGYPESQAARYFGGKIDDVRIYNRALSESEIQELYNEVGTTCTYSISPTSETFDSSGGSGSVSISTDCSWTATSNASWIMITTNDSGTGSGSISYSVSANTGTSSRTGTMTIAGKTFTITQEGGDGTCSYTISPESTSFASDGGTGSVSVSTSDDCDWEATSNSDWITITSGSSGNGDGTVNYSVSENTGTSSRTGTMTIAENTFTVTQTAATTGPLDTDDDGDGYTENEGDCDDSNPFVNPAATDTADNGIDEDCDGQDATGTSGGDFSAPTGFSYSVECDTSIFGTTCTTTFDWDAVSGASGYYLYYAGTSGNYEGSADMGNITSVTYTAIPEGTYYLALTAYDSSGNETDKSDELVVTISESLSAPIDFAVTTSDCVDFLGITTCTMNLSWSYVSISSGHNLYYATSSGDYLGYVDLGAVTSFSYAGIPEGTYYLALTAYGSDGEESDYSEEQILTVGGDDGDGLSAPMNLDVQVNNCSSGSNVTCTVIISWDKVDGASGYNMYYGLVSDDYAGFVDITTLTEEDIGSRTLANLTSIPAGTYYVKITAYDSDGVESDYSEEVVLEVFSRKWEVGSHPE